MPNSLELNVSPAQLHTFANHPFHVRKDMEMNELVDSIRESGVIVPLIVRSRPEGGYEIISGHRRCEACRELGIEKVPVRVQELTDDEATILMVNSNIQREHVLPSEKAFAYRMKLEAVKRTAGRPSKNSCQVGTNFRADKNVAESSSESARTIQRYIRLTYLISPILQMVDEARMAFNPAVEISYMTPEHQRWLQAEMELCEATPSLVQSRRLKEMSQSGTLTEHYLHTLLTEQKPNQRQKFFLNQSDVQRFFPPGYTPEQIITMQGESAFRTHESEAVRELGSAFGAIVATGGGAVLHEENYAPLHQNGVIFWLRRDLDKLERNGRPLSRAGNLNAMYEMREKRYLRFADYIIDNNRALEDTVEDIRKVIL